MSTPPELELPADDRAGYEAMGKLLGVDPEAAVRVAEHTGRTEWIPVGLQEIAELLGVTRSTVDGWRSRGVLPAPEWTVGGRPAWARGSIERWAHETGRLAGSSSSEFPLRELPAELGLAPLRCSRCDRELEVGELVGAGPETDQFGTKLLHHSPRCPE